VIDNRSVRSRQRRQGDGVTDSITNHCSLLTSHRLPYCLSKPRCLLLRLVWGVAGLRCPSKNFSICGVKIESILFVMKSVPFVWP